MISQHSNTIMYPKKPSLFSRTRSREKALALILPKLLGVLWDKGKSGEYSGRAEAFIGKELELSGIEMHPGAYCISVYLYTPELNWKKVLSAHVASETIINGVWPYWSGRCRVLSWKRGPWEDRIVAEQVQSRTVADLRDGGLSRLKSEAAHVHSLR